MRLNPPSPVSSSDWNSPGYWPEVWKGGEWGRCFGGARNANVLRAGELRVLGQLFEPSGAPSFSQRVRGTTCAWHTVCVALRVCTASLWRLLTVQRALVVHDEGRLELAPGVLASLEVVDGEHSRQEAVVEVLGRGNSGPDAEITS